MTLNCKPGDLAVIVGGLYPEFFGHIVTITEACSVHANSWETDPQKFFARCRQPMSFHDRTLRPIRDNPGQDETLTWLDVPSTDKVTA